MSSTGAEPLSRASREAVASGGRPRRRRGPRGLLIALGVYLSIVGGAHLYFTRRLVEATALPGPIDLLATGLIVLGGLSLIAGPMAERMLSPRVSRLIAWPAYLWMGCCFYLLLGLWSSDLVLLVWGVEGMAVERARATLVGGGSALLVLAGIRAAVGVPAVKRVEVTLPRWPRALDGYRIAQISDIHVGPILRRAWVERLVRRVNEVGADLIAVTGDLVDGDVQRLRPHVEPFRELSAPDGVFFVTGNHEYISTADPWVERARELGFQVLRNESALRQRDGASFRVAGVDDWSSRRFDARAGHDLNKALEDCEPGTAVVLLAHNPNSFLEARKHGVDLQLSGHTHGGQMWPFGALVRMTTPYLAGVYASRDARLYVSRGTGFWGPPVRVGAAAEITELVLRSAEP